MARLVLLIHALLLAAACGEDAAMMPQEPDASTDATADLPAVPLPNGLTYIPAEPQREGDPTLGYEALLRGDYVGCGVPRRVWDFFQEQGGGASGPPAPGSTTGLPYYLSQFTTPRGVDVVAPNCLLCHAQELNGELVIGVGGLTVDFGGLATQFSTLNDSVIGVAERLLDLNEDESFELRKFWDRMRAVAPYVESPTVGANAADNLAAILFAHRDPDNLSWSPEPILEPPPQIVVPVDPPPWWRMRQKHAMLYIGAGRGDLSRIMMAASVLCVDDIEQARQLDAAMPDVYAYLRSLNPPAYPYPVNTEAAARGLVTFERECSTCHGTYGTTPSYPNLLVDIEEVGTDPILALGGSQFADRFVEWFNGSAFFGELSRLEPSQAYVAPPLDGIWATPPFLHNGSVPTLAALLDSTQRPTYWTWSFDTADYDPGAVGWQYTALDHGQADEPDENLRRFIYDTTTLGFGNGGHTFGDRLTPDERSDLLEYLKTL